ncbi:MAG: InlB B-repeat-containing protein [Clostridia bacterium]|nr:InlB B-repeat-containing protein [Clostridia bacterium]
MLARVYGGRHRLRLRQHNRRHQKRKGVQSINKYAFAGLTGLKRVTIPDSVAVIDDDAFRFCTSLDTVTIGNGVKYIGDVAFTVVPTDENKKMYAGQLGFMQQMMESQREYYEAELEEINDSQEGYFEDVSDQLGTEVTSWQDIYDFVDGLTDEEAQNKLGISKDEYKNEIKEVETSYKLAVAEMQSELDIINNMPAVAEAVVNAQENPLERVMYAGSEEDWNAIVMGKGNEALNEAPIRTFNGQGLYYATFVADGKEVAKVTFTSGQASIAEPAVPAKAGYTGKWEAYTLGNADITVNAVYTKIAVYTATFTVDGKVVKKANVAAGTKIPVPPAPTKAGYTFKGWNPKVPAKMPAKNMTFKAVFESAAKVTFEKSASVSYRTKVTITATGENLPKGTVLAIYEKGGSKPLAKGSAKSVSYEAGEMKSAKTYEVRVIDSKGNAQKGLGGEIKIDVTGTGFFQRIIAFFKYLFSPVPTKTVGPKVK